MAPTKHGGGLDGLAGARPSRFSSPSRPRHQGRAEAALMDAVRSLGVPTAVMAIVQSLAWMAMSVAGSLVYRGVIPSPGPPAANGTYDHPFMIISNLYFREHSILPEMPEAGLVTPLIMYRFMAATLVVNAAWLVASGAMFRQVRLARPPSARSSVLAWAAVTVAVTALDAVLAAAMCRDIVLLATDWPAAERFPGDAAAVALCPSFVLVVSLRGGVLLCANVVCMLVLLRRVSRLRRDAASAWSSASGSPSATKREGPIDGFLYRNGDRDRMGVQNPVFVPEEAADDDDDPGPSYASFRPPPGEQRAEQAEQAATGYHQGPGRHGQRDGRADPQRARRPDQDDPDDVSHLSWMAEVDRHVDLRSRAGARPSAPPAHHRHGFVELPAAWPGVAGVPAAGTRLPRVRVNPNAPKFPYVPPPDYSPPAVRRTGPPRHAGHAHTHQGHGHAHQGRGQAHQGHGHALGHGQSHQGHGHRGHGPPQSHGLGLGHHLAARTMPRPDRY